MPESVEKTPMPKKSCVVTIMFPIEQDAEALKIKEVIDNAIKDMKEKRYTFQITEI